MLSYGKAFYQLKDALVPLYGDREAAAIAHELLIHITGLSKVERLLDKNVLFAPGQQERFDKAMDELRQGKPLQYVTGTAWFMEREYEVNKHVLIPRPETEELVSWVLNDLGNGTQVSILDIGTGSGIIPISLKLALPDADITAIDISEGALAVAKQNAAKYGAAIQFINMDILDPGQHNRAGIFDVIVSNPPYIPESGMEKLHKNVREYEPHLALFSPGDDPLLFYRVIGNYGKQHLSNKGAIYCEIESSLGEETKLLFEKMGYEHVELRKDMHDNWRMLKAIKNDEL